ncbi:MAG: hypothetical protein AAFQ35_05715 [Pseudomonadota bacterium]
MSDTKAQLAKFKSAAREAGCVDDEEVFERTLKKVSSPPSVPDDKESKPKNRPAKSRD